MKTLKRKWLEEMKDWTKKTMVEEDEMLKKRKKRKKERKKERRNDANDVVQKEICKIYCKTSILYRV